MIIMHGNIGRLLQNAILYFFACDLLQEGELKMGSGEGLSMISEGFYREKLMEISLQLKTSSGVYQK